MSGASSAVTLASINLGTQVAGVGSSLVGGIYSAKSQQSSLEFQADMARINAGIANTNANAVEAFGQNSADMALATGEFNSTIAELGAQSALSAGQDQIGAQTLKMGQVKSSQRAAMAANGVDIDQGSAAEVQDTTDIIKEIDSRTLQANALRAAWGYRTQGMEAQMQASTQAFNAKTQATMQAINLRTGAAGAQMQAGMKDATASTISPATGAFTSLLGSAPQVADAWFKYSDAKKAAGGK